MIVISCEILTKVNVYIHWNPIDIDIGFVKVIEPTNERDCFECCVALIAESMGTWPLSAFGALLKTKKFC